MTALASGNADASHSDALILICQEKESQDFILPKLPGKRNFLSDSLDRFYHFSDLHDMHDENADGFTAGSSIKAPQSCPRSWVPGGNEVPGWLVVFD